MHSFRTRLRCALSASSQRKSIGLFKNEAARNNPSATGTWDASLNRTRGGRLAPFVRPHRSHFPLLPCRCGHQLLLNGLSNGTPNDLKSAVFLVTTVNPCTLAVAAIIASS